MFLVNEGKVYQITQDSAMNGLESAIRERLEPYYSEKIFPEVVEEIKGYISFPDVLDTDDVYIHKDGRFSKYVLKDGLVATGELCEMNLFKPSYNGPIVDKITDLLEYSLELLLFEQEANSNAMIVQTDKDGYVVVSKSDNMKQVITTAFEEILSEEQSGIIAEDIMRRIYLETILHVGILKNNNFEYYAFTSDGSCRKVNYFSTTELSKIIKSYLPHLTSVVKKSESIAIYIHNYLLYDYKFNGFELKNLIAFKGGRNAIFKRNIKGIDFLYDPVDEAWHSNYIKIRMDQLDFEPYRDCGVECDYDVGRWLGSIKYKGFLTFFSREDEMPSDAIPILSENTCICTDEGHPINGITFYDRKSKCSVWYGKESLDKVVYIRVTHRDFPSKIWSEKYN